MAYTLSKNSSKHDFLVAQCDELFSKLPPNEYIFHDLGLKVEIDNFVLKNGIIKRLKTNVKISGLSSDPIDYWDDVKLEKLYTKLAYLLMRLYEM